jgi:hypothetical protein
MATFLRLLVLIVILNVIRYLVAGPIETFLILPSLFGQMEANPGYFNNTFTAVDWVTSYFYNFMMWACAAWAFHIMQPALKGGWYAKSYKAFGLTWLFFASVSAIYMNHYSHSKAFYVFNVLDAVIAFFVVAVANAYLYPRIVKTPGDSGSRGVGD